MNLLISANNSIEIKEVKDNCDILINGKVHQFEASDSVDERKLFAKNEVRNFYGTYLSSHFENLIILSGAGTSFGFGGKLMSELWNDVVNQYPDELKKLCVAIGYIDEKEELAKLTSDKKDLEALLSVANAAKRFIKTYKKELLDIEGIIKKIEIIIQNACVFTIPDDAPHELFLNKITNRKLKDPRVKIFTLNYDTLFEQASIRGNFTVIDGFSFSSPRTLSGRNFDYDLVYREKTRIKEEESFVPKVFHLYKPHGSVDWTLCPKTNNVIVESGTPSPLMIYPKDNKYENSYDQPFFEMMSRFQQNLRKDNAILITIGFSFNDKHIVTAIKEAVSQNPSFRLLIVDKNIDNKNFNWFKEKSKVQTNVVLVSEEFKDFSQHYPTSNIYND